MTVELSSGGRVTSPIDASSQRVGDRIVPSPIEVDLPGVDGQPQYNMRIEVLDGVPRCTEVAIKRIEGGREVRQKDLRAVELESLVETFVAVCCFEPIGEAGVGISVSTEEGVRAGMRTIREIRKGSRRPLTGERKRRIADVYNAQETGGIEAVERAFTVSRSTAARYIKAAREAGLIEKRDQ